MKQTRKLGGKYRLRDNGTKYFVGEKTKNINFTLINKLSIVANKRRKMASFPYKSVMKGFYAKLCLNVSELHNSKLNLVATEKYTNYIFKANIPNCICAQP